MYVAYEIPPKDDRIFLFFEAETKEKIAEYYAQFESNYPYEIDIKEDLIKQKYVYSMGYNDSVIVRNAIDDYIFTLSGVWMSGVYRNDKGRMEMHVKSTDKPPADLITTFSIPYWGFGDLVYTVGKNNARLCI